MVEHCGRRTARLARPLLALWVAGIAAAASAEEPFRVSSTLSATQVRTGEALELRVAFAIAEGTHLYKDSIAFQWDVLEQAKQKEVLKPKGKTVPDLTAAEEGATTEAYEGSAEVAVKFQATGAAGEKIVIKGTVSYQGCDDIRKTCYRPAKSPIAHELSIVAGGPVATRAEVGVPAPPAPSSSRLADFRFPISDFRLRNNRGAWSSVLSQSAIANRQSAIPGWRLTWGSLVAELLKAFGLGLLLSLTPCVYPMIPITVAIVGGQKKQSRLQALSLSAVYVLGISVTYAALGFLAALAGASVRNAFQSPYLLVPVAALFVVLALGMFDVLTIQVPQSVGGLGERVMRRCGGVCGVLLLGIVSGVVAGPCVAAPLGGLLIDIAKRGDPALGALMMFTLGWGMFVPLFAAGASTGLLPRAGAWMVWVKQFLGFILLWAAVYFLRPLIREMAFWTGSAGVVLAGVVFLGGLDALTPESGFVQRAKRVLGLVGLFAALGMALLGLREGGLLPVVGAPPPGAAVAFAHGDPESVDAALKSGQPVLLDFTAEWCRYCEVLDRTTFADPAVLEELKRFRAFKVDYGAAQERKLFTRYDVPGPPLILLFDSKGELVKKLFFEDFKDHDKALEHLKQVK
jgi:thiol:disulfide interchange protein DsbD